MSTNIRSWRTVAKLRYCGGICPRNGDTVVVRGTVGPVSSAGRAFGLQAGGRGFRYCIGHTFSSFITKTCLYNFDLLKPHFYIVKLGFTGVTLFLLFLLKTIDCGYSLEPLRRGGSNEYPQSMF